MASVETLKAPAEPRRGWLRAFRTSLAAVRSVAGLTGKTREGKERFIAAQLNPPVQETVP
jgi:hypothetical protein